VVVKFDVSQFADHFLWNNSQWHDVYLSFEEADEDEIKPRLERIDGVASALVVSSDEREIG